MHEMSVAQNIIDIVIQHLPNDNAHRVRNVNVKIGKMAGIVPESLEFSFQVIASDTPGMRDAVLNMHFVPLIIHCRNCHTESELDEPFFICPACNGTQVNILSGTELQVTDIEVDDHLQEK
jgi:hydrogenase nickel incorporation protein HypA/HybF